jgi:hypothetical protein
MDITSPFFVVPVLIGVFIACILFATSSKEDAHEDASSLAPHQMRASSMH